MIAYRIRLYIRLPALRCALGGTLGGDWKVFARLALEGSPRVSSLQSPSNGRASFGRPMAGEEGRTVLPNKRAAADPVSPRSARPPTPTRPQQRVRQNARVSTGYGGQARQRHRFRQNAAALGTPGLCGIFLPKEETSAMIFGYETPDPPELGDRAYERRDATLWGGLATWAGSEAGEKFYLNRP